MSTDYLDQREAAEKQRTEQLRQNLDRQRINPVEFRYEKEKLQHKTLEEVQKDIDKENRRRELEEARRRSKQLELEKGKER
jgi:hypothetical protein